MTGSGSPCGACKFLRRKCVRGCVFAPYFCHEQGATHFAAIHKVFGASNVSKLLAHLPVGDRCEAAVTISYEAQARLQDPIYGCVSHIFALQQQVVNLQAQLTYLKEQAAQQSCVNGGNPNNERYFDKPNIADNNNNNFITPQDLQSWLFNMENSSSSNLGGLESLHPNLCNNNDSSYNGISDGNNNNNNVNNSMMMMMDLKPINNNGSYYENSNSFSSFEESSSNSMSYEMETNGGTKWSFHEVDDLHSVAFGYRR
ncbi:hypothetical protein HN51_021575 [Arachis hypogaea]|uniref:LOB domain-containing protein n=1 Tax=Arachis hypogaea TaxID=3818 RepID=A0A445EFM1_ARAHY|nr:LOB domain-containing protein 29-like [Arachis hypogaea]QHO52680.1 LOB domain-containing protein [Arachis hypogaea]RYR74312.1 hypothetical protein Ahy_A02g008982 [Arachis hypogaea]